MIQTSGLPLISPKTLQFLFGSFDIASDFPYFVGCACSIAPCFRSPPTWASLALKSRNPAILRRWKKTSPFRRGCHLGDVTWCQKMGKNIEWVVPSEKFLAWEIGPPPQIGDHGPPPQPLDRKKWMLLPLPGYWIYLGVKQGLLVLAVIFWVKCNKALWLTWMGMAKKCAELLLERWDAWEVTECQKMISYFIPGFGALPVVFGQAD